MGEYRGVPSAHAFLMYAEARFVREVEEHTFRKYMATQVSAFLLGGRCYSSEWTGVLFNEQDADDNDFDPEQVADDLIRRMGGE